MGSQGEKLTAYRGKRDFRRTGEPRGEEAPAGDRPVFVIQEHAASSLHYDLRLEVDGVLKSWAVPKGPSTDPRERRLAIPTEDHPLEYAAFEGVIPEGQYGAGAVIVWDTGPYRNLDSDGQGGETPLARQIKDGRVKVWLEGEKLTGGYALIRTGGGEFTQWLLVKMDDEGADARRNPTSTQPRSVLSGRKVDEVAQEGG